MAYSKTNTTVNSTGGIILRRTNAAARKNLINLDVYINDTSVYSPYYFNVIRKPLEMKLGGNIFEFAPPRNRFKLKSEIFFEAVDSQNNPLAYEILPKREGSTSIRMCIFVYDTNVAGPGIISLVGEAILDDCGCPVPEEWEDKPNVRWSTQAAIRTDDVSDIIEYDNSPQVTVTETKVPWTYQTYEDVYDINPGSPGSPYTVSGSYNPTYNSETTNSGSNTNDGKFIYTRDIEPDTSSLGLGTIQVYHGNLRFSASMVGGTLYVSGGANHINGAQPNPHPPTTNWPAYHATISAVLNDTTAQVVPAYAGFQYEIGNFYPRTFDAKNGARITWSETSSSIGYTDPTAGTSTMTRVEKTIEQHTSYADIEIRNLKPVCGVATDVEVFVKSDRAQGPVTKLTEFPIEPTNINIIDNRTTEGGNKEEFQDTGIFTSLNSIERNWETLPFPNSFDEEVAYNTSTLMGSAHIYNTSDSTIFERDGSYIKFSQRVDSMQTLKNNSSYFIEFDAVGQQGADIDNNKILPHLDVYISGSGIAPTVFTEERTLGQYVGTVKNNSTFQRYIGNSLEYKNLTDTSAKLCFVIRQGQWFISNIKIRTCPDLPGNTGITPQTTRALIPMPAVTKFNDSYTFEFRYKNKNTTANKVSIIGRPVTFEGNDPSAFLAGQPLNTINNPIYHGNTAITTSKSFYVTGSVFVSGDIYSNEFHTNIVSSSIIFKDGDTVFGNDLTDIHITSGSVYITSSLIQNTTNEYIIKRPEGDRTFYITKGHVTQSGDIRVDKPGTTTPAIIIRPSDTAGQVDIKNGAGNTVLAIDTDDRNLYFFDKGGEHIGSDGTDLTVTAGTDIKLSPGTAVQVATDKPVRFGDSGEYISGDDTDLTIASGNDIKLNPTTAILIDTDKPIRFRDDGLAILSSADGQLDINADVELEITAPTVDIDASTTVTLDSPIVDINASTGLSLDGANLNTDWTVNTDKKIQLRDTGIYIQSPSDGQLDIVADKGINLTGGHVTASGPDASIANRANISASGLLYFSASHVVRQADQTHMGVLVYDSGSGQVFMTGSFGGSGGGGTARGAGTGLALSGNDLVINAEEDKGNLFHYVPFLDGLEGAQQLKTSPAIRYNPAQGVLKVGHSVYIHVSGSVTASKNLWVSNSINNADPLNGNYISASNIIASHHITASGNISSSGIIIAKQITVTGGTQGVTFKPAVTISNASGQSPMAMAMPNLDTGEVLMWKKGDETVDGRMVRGTIRQIINNNTYVTVIKGDDGGRKRGNLEAGGAAFVGSPGIFISSGSISFFTSSATSSVGVFNTQSATIRMFNLKGDDGTSFVMSGSKQASIYFSGSTSGKVGIGTTDPQVQFEVAADEHVFRRRSELIGMKINAEGNIESFNKDSAFAATGSELVLSYTAGGSTVVNAEAINLAFPGLIADDTSDAEAVTFFNTLSTKRGAQARILQACEKLGLFDGADVGDTLGSVRWLMRSGSEGSLNDRTSGEAGSLKMVVATSGPAGVTGKLSINLAADAGGSGQQLYSINGSTQKHEWTGSGGFHFAGATTQTGAATIKGDLTGKNTGQGQSNISGFDNLQIYGNASLGNNGNESHTFAGNITGSTTAGGGSISVRNISSVNVSSSGTITAEHFHSSDDITASGNISASGRLVSTRVYPSGFTGKPFLSVGDGQLFSSTGFTGANITASGNISSSGYIRGLGGQFGDSPVATGAIRDLDIRNNGSSYIRLESESNANQVIEFRNNQSPDFFIGNFFSDGGFQIRSDNKTFLTVGANDGDTTAISGSLNVTGISGHITSSGNISSSGTVTANALSVKGGVGTDDFFLIRSGSFDAIKTNSEGVMVLGAFTFTPTARAGGFYYDNSDDEFYLGKAN